MTATKNSVVPYLFFEGCCEEALEFYRKTLGAEVMFLMRFMKTFFSPRFGMVADRFGVAWMVTAES